MTNLTPEQMLKKTSKYLRSLEDMKKKYVAVGLPVEKVGGKAYGNGMTILRVGAIHEYGLGNNPRRSFLRVPFMIKKDELREALRKQVLLVYDKGLDVDVALGRVGAKATNISKGAFTSKGYGEWPDITQATKDRKGSSQVLVDKGILRGSITWEVR